MSAFVLTKNSAERLTPLLAHLALVADEIVVGVDEDSSDRTLDVAAAGADVVFRFLGHGHLSQARNLCFDYAHGDWILVVDDDERLERNFASTIETHLGNELLTHCWFPRKTLCREDPRLYYRFRPWFPDFQLRLFRNDRTLVWKPSRVHSGYHVQGPGIYEARTSIIHLWHVLNSPEGIVEKNEAYRALGVTDAQWDFFAASTSGPRAIAPTWLDPDPELKHAAAIPSFVHEPHTRKPAWKAVFTSIEIPAEAYAGSTVIGEIAARNAGEFTWVPFKWSLRGAWIRLTYHLYDQNGGLLSFENERFELPTMVRPGESVSFIIDLKVPDRPGSYVFEWDFLDEGEHWFAALGSQVAKSSLVVIAAAAAEA